MKIHQTDFSKGNVNRNILEMAVPMTHGADSEPSL